ncbi:unnamed protein product [Urochloa humidicola]
MSGKVLTRHPTCHRHCKLTVSLGHHYQTSPSQQPAPCNHAATTPPPAGPPPTLTRPSCTPPSARCRSCPDCSAPPPLQAAGVGQGAAAPPADARSGVRHGRVAPLQVGEHPLNCASPPPADVCTASHARPPDPAGVVPGSEPPELYRHGKLPAPASAPWRPPASGPQVRAGATPTARHGQEQPPQWPLDMDPARRSPDLASPAPDLAPATGARLGRTVSSRPDAKPAPARSPAVAFLAGRRGLPVACSGDGEGRRRRMGGGRGGAEGGGAKSPPGRRAGATRGACQTSSWPLHSKQARKGGKGKPQVVWA